MSVVEAAPKLKLAPFTVRAKCRSGQILATKENGDWDIPEEAITTYRKQARMAGANAPMREAIKRGILS